MIGLGLRKIEFHAPFLVQNIVLGKQQKSADQKKKQNFFLPENGVSY